MDTPVDLDLTGLKCPLPSLMTAKALRRVAPGTTVVVKTTDPMAPLDIRFLCERDGHEFVSQCSDGQVAQIVVRKAAA
jgi:tRNA 2-thiouridine synthesizing protein A